MIDSNNTNESSFHIIMENPPQKNLRSRAVFQSPTTVSIFSCYAKYLFCSWSSQLASGRNYSCLVMCLYMSLLLLPLYLCPMSRLMLIEIWALSVCKTTLCQHVNSCTRRNKSKTTTLSNHTVHRAERNGYAGQRRICGVLTRISSGTSYVSELIPLQNYGLFSSQILIAMVTMFKPVI